MLCATLPFRDRLNQRTISDCLSLSAFVLVVLEILLCQLHCIPCFGWQLLILIDFLTHALHNNTFGAYTTTMSLFLFCKRLIFKNCVRPIKHICLFLLLSLRLCSTSSDVFQTTTFHSLLSYTLCNKAFRAQKHCPHLFNRSTPHFGWLPGDNFIVTPKKDNGLCTIMGFAFRDKT